MGGAALHCPYGSYYFTLSTLSYGGKLISRCSLSKCWIRMCKTPWIKHYPVLFCFVSCGQILISAYEIRLYAIESYGYVIHEFDPWFNFRATQYLADNGWTAFFHWFDHRSWYPLGRPVGTTIFPGMQIVSVAIWKVFQYTGLVRIFQKLSVSHYLSWCSALSCLGFRALDHT